MIAIALWVHKAQGEVQVPTYESPYVLALNTLPTPKAVVVASTRPATPRYDRNEYVAYLYQQAPDIAPVLERIANCESGFNPLAKNTHSTASGIFQFIASTWKSWGIGDVFDGFNNIDAAIKLYRARGDSPWVCKP